VAEMAIEAGVDYISIADDYDCVSRRERLDARAKKKGVKILPGSATHRGSPRYWQRRATSRSDAPRVSPSTGCGRQRGGWAGEPPAPVSTSLPVRPSSGATGTSSTCPAVRVRNTSIFRPPVGRARNLLHRSRRVSPLPRNLRASQSPASTRANRFST